MLLLLLLKGGDVCVVLDPLFCAFLRLTLTLLRGLYNTDVLDNCRCCCLVNASADLLNNQENKPKVETSCKGEKNE